MAEYYTAERVVATVRRLMNDQIEPYFVSDEDLVDFINLTLREIARETLCLFSSERVTLTATADNPWIAAPENVVKPRAFVDPDGRHIAAGPYNRVFHSYDTYDYGLKSSSDWRTRTGTPEVVVTDLEEGRWRLVPIPVEDISYRVEGYLYPDPISSVSSALPLPDSALEGMHIGVLFRCFGIEDADAIYDPKKEGEYFARWQAELSRLRAQHNRDRRDGGRPVRMAANGYW